MSDWNKTIQEMFASPELDKAQPTLALIEAAYKEGWHTANDSAPWGSSSADHFCQKSWEDSEAIAALPSGYEGLVERLRSLSEDEALYGSGSHVVPDALREAAEAIAALSATASQETSRVPKVDWPVIVNKLIEEGLPEYYMTDDRGLDRDEYVEWFAKAYALANAASQDGGRE